MLETTYSSALFCEKDRAIEAREGRDTTDT